MCVYVLLLLFFIILPFINQCTLHWMWEHVRILAICLLVYAFCVLAVFMFSKDFPLPFITHSYLVRYIKEVPQYFISFRCDLIFLFANEKEFKPRHKIWSTTHSGMESSNCCGKGSRMAYEILSLKNLDLYF